MVVAGWAGLYDRIAVFNDMPHMKVHKALRKDRKEPAAKAQIAELLDRYARRQQSIEEKRKKQHDPK